MTAFDRPAAAVARRLCSRKVALTAAFLALAAGGTAACDASHGSAEGGWDSAGSDGYGDGSDEGAFLDDSGTGSQQAADDDADVGPADSATPTDEVFYCADEDGQIVEEDNCADEGTTTYLLWHSPAYARGLSVGTTLDGGESFAAGDRAARRSFRLPATGAVPNGTVKTNVVGRGSNGSTPGGGTTSGG